MIKTGLKDLKGKDIKKGSVCKDEHGDIGTICYSDGAFWIGYHDEPTKQWLHDMIIPYDMYYSTRVCKLTIIN